MSGLVRLLKSSAALLMLAMLAGRASGFIREVLIARNFGLSTQADMAVILLTLPDLFVNILLSGGLAAALVPKFSSIPSMLQSALFWQTSLIVGGLFLIVAMFVGLMPDVIVYFIAPGYTDSLQEDIKNLFLIVAIAIPLTALSGVSSALLNSERRFLIAGSGTLVFNLAIIFMLIIGNIFNNSIFLLACGIVMGSIFRYGVQLLAIVPNISWKFRSKELIDRELVNRFFLALFATTSALLVPIFMRSMASLLGVGNLAAFNYATKLVELPIGIAIVTLSTIALPKLSKLWSIGDKKGAQKVFKKDIILSISIAFVIMIPAIVLVENIVVIVFGSNALSVDQIQIITNLTRLGFLSLPVVAISSMSTALLNAQGRQYDLAKKTFMCLFILPLLIIPSLIWIDVRLQMGALVAFQTILAVMLFRAANVNFKVNNEKNI